MTFGIGKIDYSAVYGDARTVQDKDGIPLKGQLVNLTKLPSDAVVGPMYSTMTLETGKTYEITNLPSGASNLTEYKNKLLAAGATTIQSADEIKVGSTFTVTQTTNIDMTLASDTTDGAQTLKAGETYEILDLDVANTGANTTDVDIASVGASNAKSLAGASDLTANLAVGSTFTMTSDYASTDVKLQIKRITTNNPDTDGYHGAFREIDASAVTRNIEVVQGKINGARVQAGSQYAALESAVQYTTDLTAQYELGYNTVNDVNFSMETAHLAKNQILQQAATAMLAQANEGQQGLLQLIQR